MDTDMVLADHEKTFDTLDHKILLGKMITFRNQIDWIIPQKTKRFWFILVICTDKYITIPPNFLLWRFCGKAQFLHSFVLFAQTMRKLCLSSIFQHQEISWNYGIFCSVFQWRKVNRILSKTHYNYATKLNFDSCVQTQMYRHKKYTV